MTGISDMGGAQTLLAPTCISTHETGRDLGFFGEERNRRTSRGVGGGTVRLVGVDRQEIVDQVVLCPAGGVGKMSLAPNPYGDGRAARRIVDQLLQFTGC